MTVRLICTMLFVSGMLYSIGVIYSTIQGYLRAIPDLLTVHANQDRFHQRFVSQMMQVYSNSTVLDISTPLKDVAEKTRISAAIIERQLQIITESRLDDDEFAIIQKTRTALNLLDDLGYDAHGLVLESQVFFMQLSEKIDLIITRYRMGEFDGIIAALSEIERRIALLQSDYARVQATTNRVHSETKQIQEMATAASIRLSKAAAQSNWPKERMATFALAGTVAGYLLLVSAPLTGGLIGGVASSMFAVERKISADQTSLELQSDAVQVLELGQQCYTLMQGVQRFNATLFKLRQGIRVSKESVAKLKHSSKTVNLNMFIDVSQQTKTMIASVVSEHTYVLDNWFANVSL